MFKKACDEWTLRNSDRMQESMFKKACDEWTLRNSDRMQESMFKKACDEWTLRNSGQMQDLTQLDKFQLDSPEMRSIRILMLLFRKKVRVL